MTSVGALLAPRDGLAKVAGDRSPPLLTETVDALFRDAAARYADREAAVFSAQQRRFTWRDLDATVAALAGGLLKLGFEPGDRLGIWSPNRWEWLVTQFATARIGVILVTINPAYRLSELEYALRKVGCKGLVTAAAFKSSDYIAMLNELMPELAAAAPGRLQLSRFPRLEVLIRMGEEGTPGMLAFERVLGLGGPAEQGRAAELSATLRPEDAINIQFTSGTTGAPKGATLTHLNIVNNANFVTAAMRLGPEDRLCIPVPLYHCFGMVMGTMGCVSKGATMVFPAEGFDPGATLTAVAAERCTALYGVPTMFVAMLDHPSFAGLDLSSLRTGIMAGAPCPIEVMKKVVSLMHMAEVTIAYGMTETSPVSFQSAVDDPLEKRVATVGRVHPHVEVKVIDTGGAVVSVGQPGELCTRGYSVMQGYWEDAERTADAIDAEGWMHTGDLATIDAEGYGNIVGRVKDMVIRGGENVYPREVEEFLYRHPRIKEVQVFGVPDRKYGEELCAWIVLLPGENITENDVKAFCAGQIAHYKVPRYVRFRDSLPMTVTGKPQKYLMREAMVAELGLPAEATA